jgi:microcystin-dependent protein
MSTPFLGQITIFAGNFAPRGYAFCQGQILSISQNTALFSLLGTTYGGDGRTTFALPDLRGRVPVGAGQGPGLTAQSVGETSGQETVTLTTQQLPPHTHSIQVTNAPSDTSNPVGAVPAKGGSYSKGAPTGTAANATQTGGGQPHSNLQPSLGLNYIIALEGIYPSRN